MGSGSRGEVEALGPTEDFDWQEAQSSDEAEVSELRKAALPKIKPEVIYMMRELKKPFALSRVKPRKGHGGGTLHYIDARDVMFRLDEVVGPLNWQDSYKEVMGRIVCTLSIRFGDSVLPR